MTHRRSPGLDVLRTFAILIVMPSHYPSNACRWLLHPFHLYGWSGVDLFFVLSGFLISRQLFATLARGRALSIGGFYVRRFFRIIPCYWLVLALYFTIPGFRDWGDLPPLWRFLTFTRNYGIDGHRYPGFSHAWSLCVEEHFYLVFPLLATWLAPFATPRRLLALLAGLMACGTGLRAWAWYEYSLPLVNAPNHELVELAFLKQIYRPTHLHLDGLLLGISIAAVAVFRPAVWERLTRRGYWFLFAGVATLWLAALTWGRQDSLREATLAFPLVSLGYAGLVVAALSPTCFLSRIDSPVTRWGASLAYSLYLSHKVIICMTHRWLGTHGVDPLGAESAALAIVFSLAGALLLHFAVERPFLRLRDRLTT